MDKTKIRVYKKRTRSANFSEQNKESLFRVIHPFINILENKRTDKHTSILKSKTWENIVEQYNLNNIPHRTGYQLKAFYEAKKRQFKINKATYKKIKLPEPEIKTENLLSEISSTTNATNNDNNSSMNDDNQITISNPMVDIPKICISNNISPSNGNHSVLKCVDIKKLKTSETKTIPVPSGVVSSTFDVQKQYQSPPINNSARIYSNIFHDSNMNNSIAKNSLDIGSKLSSTIQNDINKIRLEILNDERKFRRDEHIKRMEYIELSILAMKSNLPRQFNN